MIETLWPNLLAAFGLGLVGSGHCLGMCGGIVSAFSLGAKGKKRVSVACLIGYNLGRISTYVLLAAMLASVVGLAPSTSFPLARTVAGLLLIAMGLYLANWWMGLAQLEKFGLKLWVLVKPWGDRLLPVQRFEQAFLFGLVWGCLPCGLVYSTLAFASSQNNVLFSSMTMLAFGVGTFPALFAGGLLARALKNLLSKKYLRATLAVAYLIFGIWTIAIAWKHVDHHHHSQSVEHSEQAHH